jgi:hypothetical protein
MLSSCPCGTCPVASSSAVMPNDQMSEASVGTAGLQAHNHHSSASLTTEQLATGGLPVGAAGNPTELGATEMSIRIKQMSRVPLPLPLPLPRPAYLCCPSRISSGAIQQGEPLSRLWDMRLLLLLGGAPRTEGSAHLPALVLRLLLAAVQQPAALARPKSASSSLPLPSSSRLAACNPGKDHDSAHHRAEVQHQHLGRAAVVSMSGNPACLMCRVRTVTWCLRASAIHHLQARTSGLP